MRLPAESIRMKARPTAVLAGVCMALLAGGCNFGDPEDSFDNLVASTPTARFVAAVDPACARADLLSLQPGTGSGATVNVNLVLTDCDASMTVSGVAFEITFDPASVDFIGCAAGTFFNASNLAPGTPVCTLTAPGHLLGSIALAVPVGVTVPAPGTATVVRLAFSITKQGVNTPAVFVSTDTLSGTSVFLINASGGNIVVYPLGGAGYVGGDFRSN